MVRTWVTLNKLPPNLSCSFKYLITLEHTIGRYIAIFLDGKLLQCIQHFLLNGQLFNFNIYLQGMFHTKTGLFFLTYTVFIKNENSFKMVTLLNTYNIVSVHAFTIDLAYYFFLNFLGDERELLNAILFRQIHTLQDLLKFHFSYYKTTIYIHT